MGNCVVASSRFNNQIRRKDSGSDRKLLRIINVDGKVMEYSEPILVKDVQSSFNGVGVGVSENSYQLMPPDYELKTGRTYHLLQLSLPQAGGSEELKSPVKQREETEDGGRRVRLVLTKLQLQQLLSMNISLEEIISAASGCEEFNRRNGRNWKPELDTIFEGNE